MSDRLQKTIVPKEAETNAEIVDMLKAGLDETKIHRTEQQRIEYNIRLGYIMPLLVEEGDAPEWIDEFARVSDPTNMVQDAALQIRLQITWMQGRKRHRRV